MKNFRAVFLLLLLTLLLTSCLSIPIGDGNKIKLGKGGATFVDEEGDEYKVDVGDDEISIRDGKSGESITQITEDGIKFQSEDGEDQEITFTQDGDNIKIEGAGQDETVNFEMGENVALPNRFPKDVPLTQDANITMVSENNKEVWVQYMTKQSAEKINKLYEDYFKSKTFLEEPTIFENRTDDGFIKVFEGKRKDGQLMIQFIADTRMNDMNQVSIILTLE